MSDKNVRFFSLGDSALTVEFGNSISVDENRRAIALAEHFVQQPFPGFIEAVPAYASTTIFYDLSLVKRHHHDPSTCYDAVKLLTETALDHLIIDAENESSVIEIPMRTDSGCSLDLEEVSRMCSIAPEIVLDVFLSRTYRVFMIGFLPGFAYMGEVDERIATPRKETPRTCVPKGSVGIAGRQTGIYSLESPGGWQIIGRTDLALFTPEANMPVLLRAGDQVRFVTYG